MAQSGMSPRAAATPPMAGARDPLGSTGATPQAKRPATRDSFTGAPQVHHPMSVEDLTSAFFSLNGRLDREEAWATMINGVVDENANLLSQAVSECATLARRIKDNEEKAAATEVKIIGETRSAMEHIHETDRVNDSTLRNELDAMARQLVAGHTKLETMIAGVAATAGVAGPDLPPGLDGLGEKLGALEAVAATLAQRASGCETYQGQLASRIQGTEATLGPPFVCPERGTGGGALPPSISGFFAFADMLDFNGG